MYAKGVTMRGSARSVCAAPAQHSSRSVVVSVRASSQQAKATRRGLLGLASVGLLAAARPSLADDTSFLKSTGGRGFLTDEEEALIRLRRMKEGEAWRTLEAERDELEQETKRTQDGKLCATPFGVDVVGITEAIALIGALVGGIAARQRKDELERLNEQLRKINLQLRQQARAGTIYAPGLTYAPTPAEAAAAAAARSVLVPTPKATPETTKVLPSGMMVSLSVDEDEMSQDQLACRDALRAGKKLLKEKNGSASMVRFEKALMLSKALGDKIQERRACRGLAAASRLQGQHQTAIKFLERVLEISKEMHEFTGDADAYGSIADCYTDLGEFEKAAKFYDRYIAVMSSDGVLV